MVTATTDRTREPDASRVLFVTVATEQDVFVLRRHAKNLAEVVGLDPREQVRLATVLSELGRDLLRPAAMTATFTLHREPALLRVTLTWPDERVPGDESLTAVTRLLPRDGHLLTTGHQGPQGGSRGGGLDITYALATAIDPARVREAVRSRGPVTALDDLREQTHDLIDALHEARAQRDELEELNQELVETNAGVMALYAELAVEHRDVVERYTEEHELALALQRTFLPATLPEEPGVELAVRYLPAADATEIGGDFYEAVHTPHGLLLAVGDVVGHSLQAATVMGELRHALRAYAAQGHRPHVLLEHLDHLLHLHRPGWTATVCVIVIEPGNRRLHLANAGHLPPLIITRDNTPTYLREHGPLLGMNLPQPPATTHAIATDSRLLMITDGLIETRGTDLADRLRLLGTVTAAGPADPEKLCDTLLTTFGEDGEDDIIVFATRLRHRDALA